MPRVLELPLFEEARRQFEVCNACRYCESLCAVFPAIERRTSFAEGDVAFLASLCHDCQSCLDACPYAPPHELAIDLPMLLSSVREQTHVEYAWPTAIARLVDRRVSNAAFLLAACVTFVVAATLVGAGVERLFMTHLGAGAFYEVVPWLAMMIPFMALSLLVIGIMLRAGIRFWGDTGANPPSGSRPLHGAFEQMRATARAAWEAATLAYLRGGGPGCTYPDGEPRMRRRALHSLVFYGFAAAFASTVSAAIMQDIFGIEPPYDFLSVPVVLGVAGGLAMLIGCGGLLAIKARSASPRTAPRMRAMDVAFLVALVAVNLSGFAILFLRTTNLMGILLATHLGFVAALFVALPYGKFAHALYRVLALIRNQREHELER